MTGEEHYISAKKLGRKNYSSNMAKGKLGYLPSLDSILKDVEIISQVDLGNVEIPLNKIVGTYSHLRSICFSNNFMPIMNDDSEFKNKWAALCDAHLNEGIKYSIKVYEYLNQFYVIEGNKRVSVLKYFNAYSFSANVTRLIPKKDPSEKENIIYYEFLEFYNLTQINEIWFSKLNGFKELENMLKKYSPKLEEGENKYKHFLIYVYNIFRRIYHELDGQNLNFTTGDAFLEYAKIYGINDIENETALRKILQQFIKELSSLESRSVNIQVDPEEFNNGSIINSFTTLINPAKVLKVAFVYARTISSSGWTYSHELGRLYVQSKLKNQVKTVYIENVPENDDAYLYIRNLALEGNQIIFTTSPIYRNATIKCALEFPNVRFFNCSEASPYNHVSNYFGRTYEPRFLTGIIAGAMTKSNLIGYAATSPTSEVTASINAFALGAKMVNPQAEVKVAWTKEWNSHNKFQDADNILILQGCDIISNRNLTITKDVTKKYGVFSMLCSIYPGTHLPYKYLAAPIWNWGLFYEKIINSVINDSVKIVMDMFSSNSKLINFWWGMASGVVDIYYSKEHVPYETQKLIELLKKMIISNDFNPFTGPVWDNTGAIKINEDETLSAEDILNMKWFVDNVSASDYNE
jgi:basic membrane lipoprotein Med (substrate-binding protein (PBP1-ABC) superfamily)